MTLHHPKRLVKPTCYNGIIALLGDLVTYRKDEGIHDCLLSYGIFNKYLVHVAFGRRYRSPVCERQRARRRDIQMSHTRVPHASEQTVWYGEAVTQKTSIQLQSVSSYARSPSARK